MNKKPIKLSETTLNKIIKESVDSVLPKDNLIVKGRILENTSTNFNFTSDYTKFLIKCHRGVRNKQMFATYGNKFGGGNVWYVDIYKKVNGTWKTLCKGLERDTKASIIDEMKNNSLGYGATFFTTVFELENGYDAYKELFFNLYHEGIKKANEILSHYNNNINEFCDICRLMIDGNFNRTFNDPDPLRNAAKSAAINGMKYVAKSELSKIMDNQ